MVRHMEGYVYLSKREEHNAREFFARHGHEIPDMDEGDLLGGKPLIGGLDEHVVTGRLIIPRQGASRQLREMAVQTARLTDREWQIWQLHCKGNSQGRIAGKMSIHISNVCRSLKSIESKVRVAHEQARKALRKPVPRNVEASKA